MNRARAARVLWRKRSQDAEQVDRSEKFKSPSGCRHAHDGGLTNALPEISLLCEAPDYPVKDEKWLSKEVDTALYRLECAVGLPDEELWRAVICRKIIAWEARQYVEQCSHCCCEANPNHCIRHGQLETRKTQPIRKWHQHGDRGCLGKERRCIEERVKYERTRDDWLEEEKDPGEELAMKCLRGLDCSNIQCGD